MGWWNRNKNKPTHNLGGIPDSDQQGYISAKRADHVVKKAGYTPKLEGKRLNHPDSPDSIIYEHTNHADLLVGFDGPASKPEKRSKATTAFHNRDNPVKGNPDDGKFQAHPNHPWRPFRARPKQKHKPKEKDRDDYEDSSNDDGNTVDASLYMNQERRFS
jgi:hypothetical protein